MTRLQLRSLRKASRVRSERSEQLRPVRMAAFYRWWWQNHRGHMRSWLHSKTGSIPKFAIRLYREAGYTMGTRVMNP